jgi:Chromate resistance exported protein.
MAEMIHDADLEDGKFQRTECIGINAVLSGWAKTKMGDADLLEKGVECFEGLYLQLKR